MSFEETYTAYYRKQRTYMVAIANKRLGNFHHAEEAVQDAFLKAWQYRHAFNPDKYVFGTWMNRILHNCITDKKAEEQKTAAQDLKGTEADDFGYDRVHIRKIIDNYEAIDRDRQVIALRFVEGMPLIDIPYFVDVSYANARKIVNNFVKELND